MNERKELKQNSVAELSQAVSATTAAPLAKRELPTPPQMPPIQCAVDRYLAAIRGIGLTAEIALPHIAKWTHCELVDGCSLSDDLRSQCSAISE